MAKYKNALPKIPQRGFFQKGDKGEEVKKLQRALNWANNGRIVDNLVVDGVIGPLTISAVNFFQEINHITIDGHFGKVSRTKLAKLDLTGAIKACNWALSITKDNRFTYGAGSRAHRCGCYFCKTNTGPRKKNKERKGEAHVVKDSKGNGHTYTMTYCCNTFITAAYAHGAKDPTMLKLCQDCNCGGMYPSDGWLKKPTGFKVLGEAKNVPFKNLKAGDIIMNTGKVGSGHVWMYLGADRYCEATSIDGKDKSWSADSIRAKSGAKGYYTRYQKYSVCKVVRYTK